MRPGLPQITKQRPASGMWEIDVMPGSWVMKMTIQPQKVGREGWELTGYMILHLLPITVGDAEILQVCKRDPWAPALSPLGKTLGQLTLSF